MRGLELMCPAQNMVCSPLFPHKFHLCPENEWISVPPQVRVFTRTTLVTMIMLEEQIRGLKWNYCSIVLLLLLMITCEETQATIIVLHQGFPGKNIVVARSNLHRAVCNRWPSTWRRLWITQESKKKVQKACPKVDMGSGQSLLMNGG